MQRPTATARNAERSIVVHADSAGLPQTITLSAEALRGGEQQLAAAVLALSAEAGRHAAAAERLALERCGALATVLDALGMPLLQELAGEADGAEPTSWLRAP